MKIYGNQSHSFICTDSGTGKILWVDQNGTITNELQTAGACFDVWALPDGNILYPHFAAGSDGVSIVSPSGELIFRYETKGEVFGCQPLENGNILVGELIPKRLTEVDRAGKVVKEIPVEYEGNPHECMRMPRKTKTGYYLVQPGLLKISKYDLSGKLVRQYDTYHDTFGIVEKPNGNIVYTYMDGIVELDADGREIWHMKDEDLPGINLRWGLGIQLLENGNLVITNWLGHGHENEGIMFFELNEAHEIVWYCDAREEMVLPACLQILEEDKASVCYTPKK